jgi:3-carboxy-cis,cis-muconate cycloisomerase
LTSDPGSSLFSSTLFSDLLGDAEMSALLNDRAQLKYMLKVEAALALVEGRLGMIPQECAQQIADSARGLEPDPKNLASRTRKDGVPVPALVETLRKAVDETAREYIHWGATSQDIVDTALVLALRDALVILEQRLKSLIQSLGGLADRYRREVMPGRTRFQPAVPITFGAKVAMWLAPLLRDLDRLSEMRPRLLVVSLGGAAGTLSALGTKGRAVEHGVANELGLAIPIAPWHSARDGIAELASWLALVASTTGKIGTDVILLAQAEVAELRPAESGGSSTMPHKSNPVGPEMLVTLARFTAGSVGSLFEAMIHAHERDGTAWTLEWLVLPEMLIAAGNSLQIAGELICGLVVNSSAMTSHVTEAPALLLSETAVVALAEHMPKSKANALVETASRQAMQGEHLFDVLGRLTETKIDWASLRDLNGSIAAADALVDRVLSQVRL